MKTAPPAVQLKNGLYRLSFYKTTNIANKEIIYLDIVKKLQLLTAKIIFKEVLNIAFPRNTPIQEKTGSRMETRPKGPSVFASPGGKYKLDKQSLSKEFQDGASKY